MTTLERLYRLALRAHPAEARERAGDEMARTFVRVAAAARARGRLPLVMRVAAELTDVIVTGVRERATAITVGIPGLGPTLRRLVRRPAYPLTVVVTLALGVGASTTMVSVVGVVVLDALPFPEADRLVHVWDRELPGDNPSPGTMPRSFLAWRELDDVFTAVEGFHRDTRVLTGDGDPEQVQVAVVTPGLFEMLGATPRVGRSFRDPEGRPGDDAWVVLGEELWARRYGSDPGIIGRTVTLDDRRLTVLGVMPRAFAFPGPEYEAWQPVAPVPSALTPAEGEPLVPALDVIARLRPGLEREATSEALVQRAEALAAAGAEPGHVPVLLDLEFFTTPERTRDTLVLLAGAVLFVLLIAGANVVSLGLSQAVDRRQELAVRRALGAGRRRMLTELLAENLVLALTGSGLGLLVAWSVLALLAPHVPGELNINTWGRALSIWPHGAGFALGAAVLTAPLATLLTRSRMSAAADATLASSRDRGDPESLRVQQALMAGQMGLAVILLAGTAMMAASVRQLQRVDTGYDPAALLIVSIRIPTDDMLASGALDPEARTALMDARFGEFEAALRRVPGVATVAATTSPLPSSRARFRPTLETADGGVLGAAATGASVSRQDVEGGITPADAGAMFLPINEVTPGFLATAGIEVLRGRGFTDADDPGSTIILNRTLAERLWPNADPIGRSMRIHETEPWRTVVGVVEPTVQLNLRDSWGDGAEIWLPLPRDRFGVYRTFLLRAAEGSPASLTNAVRRAVWDLDPNQPIERLTALDAAFGGTIERERFFLVVLGVFAAIATAVAAAGIYALLSRFLARRTREIGIRVALGARPGQVLARLARAGLTPSAVGILLGVAVAWPLSTVLADLLFRVEPGEPLMLVVTGAGLLGVAALACVPPGRRALRADPVEAIRTE